MKNDDVTLMRLRMQPAACLPAGVPMTAFPAAGDYYKAVQAPSPLLQRAQAPGRRVSSGTARADAGPGSSAVVFQAAVRAGTQAPPCAATSGRRLQPGPVQRAGRLLARSRPEPVRVRHHLARRAITVTGGLAGADHGPDRRPDAHEYVDFLVAGPTLRPVHAGGPVARAGRAAPAERGSPTATSARNVMWTRTGSSAWSTSTGSGFRSWPGSPAQRVRPPELPSTLAPQLGPLARHLLRLVIYLSLVGAGQGSRLWLALYNSKNLLFAKTDFFPRHAEA